MSLSAASIRLPERRSDHVVLLIACANWNWVEVSYFCFELARALPILVTHSDFAKG
jgi:hypothetical protein